MSDKKRTLTLQCSVGEFIDKEVVTPQISVWAPLSFRQCSCCGASSVRTVFVLNGVEGLSQTSCKPRQKQAESLLLIKFWSLVLWLSQGTNRAWSAGGLQSVQVLLYSSPSIQALRVKFRESDINWDKGMSRKHPDFCERLNSPWREILKLLWRSLKKEKSPSLPNLQLEINVPKWPL